jgi:hypothetical protein
MIGYQKLDHELDLPWEEEYGKLLRELKLAL